VNRIAVIGGGISGLAAAYRLTELAAERRLQLDVVVLDAGSRSGGVIATEKRDGYLLEHGPESMITDKPWGLDLVRRLGIEDRLIRTQDRFRRSFVVRGGKLHPVPEGFQILAPAKFGPVAASPIFSWSGKARMALDLLIPARRDPSDESLGEFVSRRLGREALERMAQPMIAGIYGADPMELSVEATLPRFREMERQHGSVIRGMWARAKAEGGRQKAEGSSSNGVSGARYGLFVSFREGMQTLTDALGERLPKGALRLNTAVRRLSRNGAGWILRLDDGSLEADGVIVALPAYGAAALLEEVDGRLAGMLKAIQYGASATINLAYRTEDIPHPLDGFGFVVPEREGLTILGCTFSHVKWPGRAPEGYALLRAFLGGGVLGGRGDAELERLVREDLRKLLGITAAPELSLLARQPHSMAQYRVGHLERVAEMERLTAALAGLALAGNAYRGIGIPDCIRSAEEAVERVIASVEEKCRSTSGATRP